ncbi:MAG: Type 1 glutamine amidotransferase-like domain-containing protein [Candidatus Woesearchaeota archaeon]|nr:MAG: Type 1 glutamine amidotransferase-like domain-containing protein [Candidatus Woesearchaeota archaeon]
MKYYLSSFKIGNEPEKLKQLVNNRTIGFIPNSLDHVPEPQRSESNQKNMQDLTDLGIRVELLDLRAYFGKNELLRKKLKELGGVWVRGGLTFILRQAMYLSGFDVLIKEQDDNFLYGGYSAGVCVLAPSLEGIQQVDDPTIMPYKELQTPIMEGLNLLPYLVLPHYKSDHPESALIDKEVEYCTQHNIPFKTLKDGEVIILE